MIRRTVRLAIVCFLLVGGVQLAHLLPGIVYAQDDWKAEFADICSKTDDPMVLSKAEVAGLVERCDKLRPRIEKLDESTAKVYLKRLQMCKDLFVFVLETKSR